jgi:ATP-dependent helicase/nuclease subunit A
MNPGANASQRRAAAPDASVWVAASAGTGKTKVLTDRLLALMLDCTDPARILCLTFTRAAAAEMANRLNEALAKWATLPRGALALELAQLTGTMPDDALLARARQLFAHVLDAPGGIKIATIHAFCQSLLRRFPLEAEVPPEFAVLEERSAGEALIEAGEAVVVAARDGREPWLAEALAVVARWAAEERFAALLGLLARDREKLREVVRTGYGVLRQRLCAAFSLPAGATPAMVVGEFCAAPATVGLAAAAAALATGSSSDRQSGATIAAWLDAAQDRHAMLDAYSSVYLTGKREIRDRLITKDAARAAGCDAAAILLAEAQRVREFDLARRAAAIVEASEAVIRLGDALLRAYDERKRQRGVLDYDDLVQKSLELLRRPTVAPWVLFKLDGGLDHILIDEAQDTNPEQWEIVAALAEEFFAGDGADERPRTVFAVGDAKQSIYSFQRADPQAFLRMRRHFEQRVSNARQQWRVVPLDISFRSTEAVLQAVDAIFRHPEVQDGVALDGSPIRHVAARAGQAGLV